MNEARLYEANYLHFAGARINIMGHPSSCFSLVTNDRNPQKPCFQIHPAELEGRSQNYVRMFACVLSFVCAFNQLNRKPQRLHFFTCRGPYCLILCEHLQETLHMHFIINHVGFTTIIWVKLSTQTTTPLVVYKRKHWPGEGSSHYNDVIMGAMASQVTGVTIVCSTVGSVRRRSKKTSKICVTGLCDRWIPHTKGHWHGNGFHLMTSSLRVYCVKSNGLCGLFAEY